MCSFYVYLRLSAAQGAQVSAAAGQGSSSGSFAFSRALATTPAAPQQLGARMEEASVDPLGFFAADGGRALHRRQGEPGPFYLPEMPPQRSKQSPQNSFAINVACKARDMLWPG